MKNPTLILYSFMIGAMTSVIYIFAAASPVIVIQMMGVDPSHYGLLNLIPASGFFLGNVVSARLASFFKIKTVLKAGIILVGLGIVCFAILLFGLWTSPYAPFLSMFITYFGVPLFYSNAAVIATFRVPDKPNASSIMSFLNIGTAAVSLFFIGFLPFNPFYAIPTVFIVIFLITLILFRHGQKLVED